MKSDDGMWQAWPPGAPLAFTPQRPCAPLTCTAARYQSHRCSGGINWQGGRRSFLIQRHNRHHQTGAMEKKKKKHRGRAAVQQLSWRDRVRGRCRVASRTGSRLTHFSFSSSVRSARTTRKGRSAAGDKLKFKGRRLPPEHSDLTFDPCSL